MVSVGEFHRRLLAQNGDSAQLPRRVYEWIENFERVQTSVMHEGEAGHPSNYTTDERIQQPREMVMANRRVIIYEVADSLQNWTIVLCSSLVRTACGAAMFTL